MKDLMIILMGVQIMRQSFILGITSNYFIAAINIEKELFILLGVEIIVKFYYA